MLITRTTRSWTNSTLDDVTKMLYTILLLLDLYDLVKFFYAV